jgi:F0F1-type ATP synthase membrane subunit b/b'
MPAPVDPKITDKAAKRTATQAYQKALKERQELINKKLKDQKEDIDEAAALAQSYEAMSVS